MLGQLVIWYFIKPGSLRVMKTRQRSSLLQGTFGTDTSFSFVAKCSKTDCEDVTELKNKQTKKLTKNSSYGCRAGSTRAQNRRKISFKMAFTVLN